MPNLERAALVKSPRSTVKGAGQTHLHHVLSSTPGMAVLCNAASSPPPRSCSQHRPWSPGLRHCPAYLPIDTDTETQTEPETETETETHRDRDTQRQRQR
eukprot:1981602-Rhodomonas_salina.1